MKLRQGEIIALVPELTMSSGFEYSLTSATEKKPLPLQGRVYYSIDVEADLEMETEASVYNRVICQQALGLFGCKGHWW